MGVYTYVYKLYSRQVYANWNKKLRNGFQANKHDIFHYSPHTPEVKRREGGNEEKRERKNIPFKYVRCGMARSDTEIDIRDQVCLFFSFFFPFFVFCFTIRSQCPGNSAIPKGGTGRKRGSFFFFPFFLFV